MYAVENAIIISPLPLWMCVPVLPSPIAALLASLFSCRSLTGASVAITMMTEPSGFSIGESCCQLAKRHSLALPKFVSDKAPTVKISSSCSIIQEDEPIPPFCS